MDEEHHFIETVVEEVEGIEVDPEEEIVSSLPQTIVTSTIGHLNAVVYTDGPDGIIMEGDEIPPPEIVGEVITDDSQELPSHKTVSPSHVLHVDLGTVGDLHKNHQGTSGRNDVMIQGMLGEDSIVVTGSHHEEPGFIAMKPHSVGEVILGDSHVGQIILHEGVGSEMIVEQNVEVGSDGVGPHGDIILVPNSMIKQEDIIEGGEVVVGSNVGNEIVIGDHIGTHGGGERFVIGSTDVDSENLDDTGFGDSKLVIDTRRIKMEDCTSVGFECPECGSILRSRASLKKHLRNHHNKEKPPKRSKKSNCHADSGVAAMPKAYRCPSCPYSSNHRDKLDKHIEKHVLLEGFHPCGKRRHKPDDPPRRHRHGAEEYKCPFCPYTCTVYKAIKKHNKLHNSGTKQFTIKVSCKICGKDRQSEADMQKHMKKHRNGETFMCDMCGFASIQLKKIIQHRRMHTGEKPHLCPHCTYRSARRDNLRSHVRRMHKKQNMYIDTFNPAEEIID